MLDVEYTFQYICEKVAPLHLSCGLTWMILLKVSGLLPNLEVYGERLTLVDLASVSIVLLRVFMEMARISKWCLVHLWGAKYQPIDTCVMMALLFLAPVYAEFAMWIWSVTSPLLYVYLYFVPSLPSLAHKCRHSLTCSSLFLFVSQIWSCRTPPFQHLW